MKIVLTENSYQIWGGDLLLRPVRANLHDGCLIADWRNEDSARDAFWNTNVVTPDSHVAFIRNKSPYDLIWIVQKEVTALGMVGLIVDPQTRSGEAGRYYIEPRYRGKNYAVQMDELLIDFSFDFLHLQSLWLDAWDFNTASIATHLRAGWHDAGLDVVGHRRPNGPVRHMTLTVDQWRESSLQHE